MVVGYTMGIDYGGVVSSLKKDFLSVGKFPELMKKIKKSVVILFTVTYVHDQDNYWKREENRYQSKL